MPSLLFACTALKPVEKLTDKELIDKYYETDLKLYMVKRTGRGYTTDLKPSSEHVGKGIEYSKNDLDKIRKFEKQLEVMRQELIKREYIP